MREIGGDPVSVIGYGAWEVGGDAWGPNPDEDEVIGAIRSALDAGMTWIDTAEIYGNGRSEELVGKAIAGREDVFVATKVGESRSGYHAEGVRRGAEGSLKRLGRDAIDLYQVHWPGDRVPLAETWEAMARLVDDGLVRHIGLSNFARRDIERCEPIRHVDSLQNQFSMLYREGGDDLYPWCAENGTAVFAYGPLAFGLLTGAIGMDTEFDE
ncbi:MAG TPA: aldo/keto reductase, partial [Actinomycetota bacterium]|nr:aldo/keto reductase [Actinomycetota bacterium]